MRTSIHRPRRGSAGSCIHLVSCIRDYTFHFAVPRGLALAWFVFPNATAFWTYSGALLAAWAYSVASICVLRRVKDLPKAVLARDVAFIVLCYVSPVAVGAASELLSSGACGDSNTVVLESQTLSYAQQYALTVVSRAPAAVQAGVYVLCSTPGSHARVPRLGI